MIELARARTRHDQALPMTLRGAIGARLDDLAERERQLLQASAIVGEAFTARDTAILLARDLGEIHASLDHLVDLLYLRSGSDGTYRFHHGLVREVAYGQLPIAERLRLLRTGKGLSQEAFAAKCGLDRTYISGIERGKRNVSLRNIQSLAQALHISLAVLMKGL